MSNSLPEMGFWDHVDALRGTLLRIALVVGVFMIGWFIVMPWFFDHVIMAPCKSDFILYRFMAKLSGDTGLLPDFYISGDDITLINIQLASQFFIHLTTSFWLAIVSAFPIVIYLLWTFVAPGLYEKEKTGLRKAFVMGNIMFFCGVATGYFVVFPLTLRFLADYHISAMVPNTISLDSYMDNFLVLIFVMGIVFELPVLAWMLGKGGLIKRSLFTNFRRHAIVALLILAAIITPTGDPFTLMVVFVPIYALWEMGALLVPKDTDSDSELTSE